jgi:hypothetical protein
MTDERTRTPLVLAKTVRSDHSPKRPQSAVKASHFLEADFQKRQQ